MGLFIRFGIMTYEVNDWIKLARLELKSIKIKSYLKRCLPKSLQLDWLNWKVSAYLMMRLTIETLIYLKWRGCSILYKVKLAIDVEGVGDCHY